MARVRMVDIAEALGLSKATVSMALRGDPRIALGTRERVLGKAEEMGYVPDPALSRLAQQRWGVKGGVGLASIALVAWDDGDYPAQRERLRRELANRSREMGYGLEPLTVSRYASGAAAARVLLARGVRGIVAVASRQADAWQGFPWEEFSGVEVLAGSGRGSGLDNIRFDAFGDLLRAGERVEQVRPRAAGIVLIRQDQPSLTDERDFAAAMYVRHCWCERGIRCPAPKLLRHTPEMGRKLAQFVKREQLDVVIVPNSGNCWAFDESDLKIPDRVRVIAMRRLTNESIAGFDRDLGLFAERVLRHVDGLLRHDVRGLPESPLSIVVPDRWHPGPSFPER